MTDAPQLCLGTVQFGLSYGITNQRGQVPETQVRQILDLASKSGINLLDTAQAYGTSEEVLGRCWPADVPRRLISKLPADAPSNVWEDCLITSLRRLKATKLDSFLLHRASDLLAPNGHELLHWLESLRERGLVERIGISIYDAFELEGLPLDRLQLVQLPLSIYDQRLILDGTVDKLNDQGIAVHARSVFLQGLLLQPHSCWPAHLSQGFRSHHCQWLEYLGEQDLTQLACALGFVRALRGLEAILVGVLSVQELAEILQAWTQALSVSSLPFSNWPWHNPSDLDPRCWPPR